MILEPVTGMQKRLATTKPGESSIKGERLLILVDQFEELFRFRRGHAQDAAAFVALLLAATSHSVCSCRRMDRHLLPSARTKPPEAGESNVQVLSIEFTLPPSRGISIGAVSVTYRKPQRPVGRPIR